MVVGAVMALAARPAIRPEQAADSAPIGAVHRAAFPTPLEAQLVDALRAAGLLTVSLVAAAQRDILGHVAFSPVAVAGVHGQGLGLAPLAVQPRVQKQGIGAALVRAGLEGCRRLGAPFVVVLGEPAYYRRFGFAPASRWRLGNEYGAADEFMALELVAGGIPREGGLVQYAAPFRLVA